MPTSTPTTEELCATADEPLVCAILLDPTHVLRGYLPPTPPNRETGYYLRPRLQNVPLSDLTRQGYMYISSMLYISYSSLRSTLTLYCYQYSYFDVLSPSSIIDVTIMDVRLEMVY